MTQTISLEPNWNGLRRWALAALKTETGKNRKPFEDILAECEKAKAAGRPDANWQ